MKTKRVTRYYANCGRGFWSKKGAENHEGNCKCWTNPKYRTCLSCKHGEQIWNSDGDALFPQTWREWQCNNIEFDYDKHHTPAHEKAEDLCINCPVWESK